MASGSLESMAGMQESEPRGSSIIQCGPDIYIYRGLFSLNNSRETPIAHPLGRGMGVYREILA